MTAVSETPFTYGAGYQITNESVVIPATPPYSVPAQAPYGEWASDGFGIAALLIFFRPW